MINVLGLEQYDKDAINESYDMLAKKYKCTIENDLVESFTNKLVDTKLMEDYSTVSIKNIIKVENGKCEFYVVSIYLANIPNRVAPRVLMYGVAFLKKNMKSIFIRPETLWDKIGGMFSKKSIDFDEHKGFSNKYCLFAKDKEFVKENLSPAFLNEVYGLNRLHFEFYDKMALATFNKLIAPEETMQLADFMTKIVPMF
jgi:hypothetical protein